jgi:hypothetical protein
MTGLTAWRLGRERRSAAMTRRFLSATLCVTAAAALLLLLGPGQARARTTRAVWHTCTRQATHRVGIYEDDNDHFTGMPGPSCITVTHGTQIRIDRNYEPHRGAVVAYDAIRIGEYPYNRDPGSGLPALVSKLRLTLRETTSGGPGTYLYDDDIWFSRADGAGPLLHIREIIIANRWRNYDPRRGDDVVKIGRRRWSIAEGYTGSGGRSWPLIRFVARKQADRLTIDLAAFLHIARRHHWISNAMYVDSVSYGPEVWSGGRGLAYSMTKKIRRHR